MRGCTNVPRAINRLEDSGFLNVTEVYSNGLDANVLWGTKNNPMKISYIENTRYYNYL